MSNSYDNPSPIDPQNENTQDTLYPGLSASSRRMLGLREFPIFPEHEIQMLFPSEDRYHAYQQIQADTYPQKHKKEFKKGITRTVVGEGLIPGETFADSATVYLGSGIDIAYLLALGARNNYLVDPIFREESSITALEDQIRLIKPDVIIQRVNNQLQFNFNFNHTEETAHITLLSEMYGQEPINLPENIGLVVTFASQGPGGHVAIGEDITQKMTQTSYLLEENHLRTRIDGEEFIKVLGK